MTKFNYSFRINYSIALGSKSLILIPGVWHPDLVFTWSFLIPRGIKSPLEHGSVGIIANVYRMGQVLDLSMRNVVIAAICAA